MQKTKSKLIQTLVLGAVLSMGVLGAANAAVITGKVRVMLPDNTIISLSNTQSHPWYQQSRVSRYHNWYYDSQRRAYVVTNRPVPRGHVAHNWNDHDNRNGAWHHH